MANDDNLRNFRPSGPPRKVYERPTMELGRRMMVRISNMESDRGRLSAEDRRMVGERLRAAVECFERHGEGERVPGGAL